MKPRISIVLFLVCVCLSALLLVQWKQLGDEKQLRQKLQLQVETMQGEIQAAEGRAEVAEGRAGALEARAEALNLAQGRGETGLTQGEAPGRETAAPSAQGQPGAQRGANPMAMMSEMMKNPETREAFKQQQQFAMNLMYNPLLEKLELKPEEKEAFKELLLEQHMYNIEQGAELMDQGSTNRTALAEQMAAAKVQWDEEAKALLGEEQFQEFQDYQLTMGERMMLNQQMQLPPEQMEELLGIMAEEKRALQMTQMPGMDPSQNPELIMEEGFMEQHLANQETINAHVYERARAMLTPEQLAKLDEFLKNQVTLQKGALQMARKMMQPDAGLAPASPVPEN